MMPSHLELRGSRSRPVNNTPAPKKHLVRLDARDTAAGPCQLRERGCSPFTTIVDALQKIRGKCIDTDPGTADGTCHRRHRVGIPTHADRRTNGFPIIVGRPEKGVQAPEHARDDERRDALPVVTVAGIEACGMYVPRGFHRTEGDPLGKPPYRRCHRAITAGGAGGQILDEITGVEGSTLSC